MLDKKIAIIDI